MGNLHEGHLSLARLAREHADRVVLSIYVNPTQFGAGEDFAAYPRTLEEDRALIDEDGLVDAIFVPDDPEIYPFGADQAVRIALSELGSELCGQRRPGHFDGVATVVCRLLNIVAPDTVVFGRKDYQQLLIIERVVADLRLPVKVISGPTIRHEDGLAISSRNRYLNAGQRKAAPALYAALGGIEKALKDGSRDYGAMQQVAVDALRASGFEPDYIEVRRAADLARPQAGDRPDELIVLAAAWLGKARLIDNLKI